MGGNSSAAFLSGWSCDPVPDQSGVFGGGEKLWKWRPSLWRNFASPSIPPATETLQLPPKKKKGGGTFSVGKNSSPLPPSSSSFPAPQIFLPPSEFCFLHAAGFLSTAALPHPPIWLWLVLKPPYRPPPPLLALPIFPTSASFFVSNLSNNPPPPSFYFCSVSF